MASAQEIGNFEVKFADQQENNPVTVYSQNTGLISGGALAVPTGATMEAIPKSFAGQLQQATASGRVLVFFTADSTDIIESEESQWEIPCLVYNLDNTLVGRKTLTQNNMTGFTTAGTVDLQCTANVPTRVAYFDVPRGLKYMIEPEGKIRAYIGDDTA